MARAKNYCGKMRKIDDPYETWTLAHAGWTWQVLKKYQTPENEKKNPYARWLVAAKSPHTYGSWDMGDTYVHEIKNSGAVREINPKFREEMKELGIGIPSM